MTPARTAGAGWRDAFVTPHLPVGAGVADLLRTGQFTETQLRAGAYAELQLGHATYWRLRLDRGRQLTRLTNSLRQVFPEMAHVFKDLTGVTAQAVIRGGPAAAQIRTLSWAEFLARVRTAACGQRLAISRLHRLYALAPVSIGLTQGVEALCFDVESSLANVRLLDQQTRVLLARLRPVFDSLPEAPFLRSIEGLGEISALGTAGRRGGNGSAGPVREWQGFNQASWHPAHPESLWANPAFQDALLQTRAEPPALGTLLGDPAAVEPQRGAGPHLHSRASASVTTGACSTARTGP